MRKTITYFIVLYIFVFSPQLSRAQENFSSGYIVNKNGDTIKGLIDYRNWSSNPKKIKFKKNNKSKQIKFTPKEILSFTVENEKYFSAIVQVETSPVLTNELDFNSKFMYKTDTVFIRAIIIGNKSLYQYRTPTKKDQFYIKEGSNYTLLKYKRYLTKNYILGKTKVYIKERNLYLAQLKLYLSDYKDIEKHLINTKYNLYDLEKLFLNYYKNIDTQIEFYKKVEKLIYSPGVLIGMSSTSLSFSDNLNSLFLGMNLNGSNNITAALALDLILPRNYGKWSFYNELAFTTYEFENSFTDYVNDNVYTDYELKYGHSYIKLFNMFRFNYSKQNIFFYINIGMSNGFYFTETNYYKEIKYIYGTTYLKENKILKDTRRYEIGFISGAGIGFKNFFIDFKYEIGNGTSIYVYSTSTTYRYYVSFGFKFMHKKADSKN